MQNDTEPEPSVENQLPFIWAVLFYLLLVFYCFYLYFSEVNYLHILAFILFSVETHTKSGHKLNSQRACISYARGGCLEGALVSTSSWCESHERALYYTI